MPLGLTLYFFQGDAMIKKLYPLALSAVLVFGGFLLSSAEDLVIDGLGRLPFPKDVTVTDGGGSELSYS